jgi:CubicO group peptidase (beta-lactamase class C family)
MTPWKLALWLVLLYAASPEFTHTLDAQTIRDKRFQERIEHARDTLITAMKKYGTPGASVTLSIGGRVVWSEGFGMAHLELQAPATPQTKFRIGSVSKALTAGAVALLVQDTLLDLDLPVQTYVPSFPLKRYQITTRQVAGHLGGIRHYRGNEFMSRKRYATVGEGLGIFQDDSLLFKPGTRYSYSSYGTNLVSAVIEGASKQSYLDYMREMIFEPFGMKATVPEYPDSIIPGRSAFYFSGNPHTNTPTVDNSYKWAGGGFLSTTEDLISYAHAILFNPLFEKGSRQLMFTSQSTSSGRKTNYSIGWQVQTIDDHEYILHGGGSVGGTAMLILVPKKHVAIAILCNDDSRFVQHTMQILNVFL